jgi:hypothetical protein
MKNIKKIWKNLERIQLQQKIIFLHKKYKKYLNFRLYNNIQEKKYLEIDFEN